MPLSEADIFLITQFVVSERGVSKKYVSLRKWQEALYDEIPVIRRLSKHINKLIFFGILKNVLLFLYVMICKFFGRNAKKRLIFLHKSNKLIIGVNLFNFMEVVFTFIN